MWRVVNAGHGRCTRNAHRQFGFSLLEVLITVVILSIGLLGMAALQASALKNNQSSFQRSQAVMLIYYMMDAMRTNRSDAASEQYDMTKTCTVPAAGSTLVANDRHVWLQALKDNIGDSTTTCGEIDCTSGATATCTVRVYWDDGRATNGSAAQTLDMATRL
jgi:type IV pilus assembly protein PilV